LGTLTGKFPRAITVTMSDAFSKLSSWFDILNL
jgi:hypothetical protein